MKKKDLDAYLLKNINISIIVAMSQNSIIGKKNKIPWYIKQDLLWFKKNTIGKTIIMGRKTWESIGFALPMRQNIVLTRKKNFVKKNVLFTNSIDSAVKSAEYKKEIMIIGGSNLYKQMLPFSNKLYLTKIKKDFSGDKHFPKYNIKEWKKIFKKNTKEYDQKNNLYIVKYEILKKIKNI